VGLVDLLCPEDQGVERQVVEGAGVGEGGQGGGGRKISDERIQSKEGDWGMGRRTRMTRKRRMTRRWRGWRMER